MTRGLGRFGRSRSRDVPDAATPPDREGPATPAEELLLDSALFDDAWYAAEAAGPDEPVSGRLALIRHYLAEGSAAGLTPHPLVDPATLAQALGDRLPAGRDPLVAYLRQRAWRLAPHPLFDARGYLADHPDALEHTEGPLGHLIEHDPAVVAERAVWIRARTAEWQARHDALAAGATEQHPGWPVPAPTSTPVDSVAAILDAGLDPDALEATLDSLARQGAEQLQVVVLDRGGSPADRVRAALPGADVVVVPFDPERPAASFEDALAAADGTWVAFVSAGERWQPGRLAALVASGADLAADALEAAGEPSHWRLPQDGPVTTREAPELAQLLVRRTLLDSVAPPLTDLRGAWDFDLVVRLLAEHEPMVVEQVGVVREDAVRRAALAGPDADRPSPEHEWTPSWRDVVLGRRLVDWDALAARADVPGLVSVIVPTYDDWRMTAAAVDSVMAAAALGGPEVECLVWDNGSSATASLGLDALAERHGAAVRLHHSATNHGFALGNDLALADAHGEFVVFLNNDTTVPAGWLAPLLDTLAEPGVLGVQPLLVYPTGAVQSAGVAFPPSGALPHALLRGFPVEDAAGLAGAPLAALTGAALVMRRADAVAMRGFDPVFTNGMEDVDLCQRLAAAQDGRAGEFRLVPEVEVVHHESRTPGRYARHLDNRRVWLDRWQDAPTPADDADLWARCGFTVVDHVPAPARGVEERRLLPLDPVLVRPARLRSLESVHEHPPRLRWAIKSSSPAGAAGDVWGDTHFAHSLAAGLRACGQEVVVDRRPEHHRSSGHHDDVVLALRGLARYHPEPGQTSLLWVISHPDLVERSEAAAFDVVFAAGPAWAASAARAWGVPIAPLLQATDPDLFAPDFADLDPAGEPVLFVGNSRREYRRIVRDAVEAGVPVGVHGGLWERFLPPEHWRGPGIANAELARAYRSAGVVLNDHWADMAAGGFVSNRLFDAVAAGARVISDDVAGSHTLADLFGPSVQVYRDPGDLARLSALPDPDAVFGSDTERTGRAHRIRREHSFEARARTLLDAAVSARGR
ncbi:glycosyltransferase [Nocardioides sp. GXZ039]|uniref:glycosyltransferase n=1 Tax=Nocardioides sp. GXZ039 TaxID=3136018 RepID=UPI0030F39AA8